MSAAGEGITDGWEMAITNTSVHFANGTARHAWETGLLEYDLAVDNGAIVSFEGELTVKYTR